MGVSFHIAWLESDIKGEGGGCGWEKKKNPYLLKLSLWPESNLVKPGKPPYCVRFDVLSICSKYCGDLPCLIFARITRLKLQVENRRLTWLAHMWLWHIRHHDVMLVFPGEIQSVHLRRNDIGRCPIRIRFSSSFLGEALFRSDDIRFHVFFFLSTLPWLTSQLSHLRGKKNGLVSLESRSVNPALCHLADAEVRPNGGGNRWGARHSQPSVRQPSWLFFQADETLWNILHPNYFTAKPGLEKKNNEKECVT